MPTGRRPDLAAAAPRWVRDLIRGWAGEATVLHSGPDAVYLRIDREVVAVLSREAVRVPCALLTTLPTTGPLGCDGLPPAPGTKVVVDDQRLHFSGADLRVGRTTSHAAPVIDPTFAPAMATRLAGDLDPAVGPVHAELPAGRLRALAAADPRAVDGLLGLGSGLTPLGDDVLCGWLATLVAASHPCATPVGERALVLAEQRTSALSATLLRRAAVAEVVPPFAHLVSDLISRPGSVAQSVDGLVRVGHTSGRGLVLGLALALDHLASRSTCP